MPKIRILATEDDPIHEEKLRMAMDILNYELIDVIVDPHQVLSVIRATKPDVLLMDIDLGSDISGIDLSKKINEFFDIPLVFITSFVDKNTFNEAKKTFPTAYLTKPYKIDELERAVELAVLQNQSDYYTASNKVSQVSREHLFIKEGSSLIKVLIKEINYIEAYDKYCYIHCASKKRMIKERLKNIAAKLPESCFCQVHRSYIVNLDSIDSIRLDQNKVCINGKEISISKSFKSKFLSKINALG